jgi:tetratricopeptide (TPR) repeat protein
MAGKEATIAEVRRLIGRAEVEPAIERLLAFLEREPTYRNLHSDALQTLAQYRKTRREETQGIISYEQARLSFNQVNNQVLNILEELEREPAPGRKASRRRPLLFAGAGAVLLIAAGIWWFTGGSPPADPLDSIFPCPGFSPPEAFRILLLPYRALSQDEDIDDDTPVSLRTRFQQVGSRYGIELSPQIVAAGDELLRDPNRLPPDPQTIAALGERCGANLIIYGLSEAGGGRKVLTTSYRFLRLPKGGVSLTRLTMQENTQVDTLQFISSIATQGTVTEEIENTLKLLFLVIAHEQGDDEAVFAEMNAAEFQDDTARLIRNMIVGDSYLRTGQYDQAYEAFDTMVADHPEYWLGWYNRGVLNLKKGDLEQAVTDLSERLKISDDPQARLARSEAYLRLDQLSLAARDLMLAHDSLPGDRVINLRLKKIRTAIETEKERSREADETLRANPDDTAALRAKTLSEYRLGNFRRRRHLQPALAFRRSGKPSGTPDPQTDAATAETATATGGFGAGQAVMVPLFHCSTVPLFHCSIVPSASRGIVALLMSTNNEPRTFI